MLPIVIAAGLVPMISGSPGMGKSAISHKFGTEFNLQLIDMRLAQSDPTDLLGFPSIVDGKARYIPMETFPVEGDELPEGKDGWLLFLDEFTSAPQAVQAAAYKLVLDRMVGLKRLHKNVAIICAGNLETDGAIVYEMSTALQSRLIHFELMVDPEQWCDYAISAGFDHRITDYIKFKPLALYTFRADHTDKTYGCSRTWEFADRVLKKISTKDQDCLGILAGTLSEGLAREFLAFTKIYDSLPKMDDIKTMPDKVMVPDEPSVLFALTGSLSNHINPKNSKELMVYIGRLPVEFQAVALREIVRRNNEMLSDPPVVAWIDKFAAKLF